MSLLVKRGCSHLLHLENKEREVRTSTSLCSLNISEYGGTGRWGPAVQRGDLCPTVWSPVWEKSIGKGRVCARGQPSHLVERRKLSQPCEPTALRWNWKHETGVRRSVGGGRSQPSLKSQVRLRESPLVNPCVSLLRAVHGPCGCATITTTKL